jgi:cytochrome c6
VQYLNRFRWIALILAGIIIWISSSASWAVELPVGTKASAMSPMSPQMSLPSAPGDLPLSADRLAAVPVGKQVFTNNCSACHVGGGNVLIAEKTLMKEALEKYGMESLAAIQTQVTQGKNAMPSFAKRLSMAEIEAVAGYVLTQAEAGW